MKYDVTNVMSESGLFEDLAHNCASAEGYPSELGEMSSYNTPEGPDGDWYFHDEVEAWNHYADAFAASELNPASDAEVDAWLNEEMSKSESEAFLQRVTDAVEAFKESLSAN